MSVQASAGLLLSKPVRIHRKVQPVSPHCGLLLSVGRTRRVHVSSRSIPCFSAIAKRSSTLLRAESFLSFPPLFPFFSPSIGEEGVSPETRRDEIIFVSIDQSARVAKFDWSVSSRRSGVLLVDDGTGIRGRSGRARTTINKRPDNKWFLTDDRGAGFCKSDICILHAVSGVTDTTPCLLHFRFCLSFRFTPVESVICRVERSPCGCGRRIDPTYSLRVVKGD